MTVAAHKVLDAFNALAPDSDDAFDELTAEVFRGYDAEESTGAER
jgi:hypothetical protein